jgi:hypothetical protein
MLQLPNELKGSQPGPVWYCTATESGINRRRRRRPGARARAGGSRPGGRAGGRAGAADDNAFGEQIQRLDRERGNTLVY